MKKAASLSPAPRFPSPRLSVRGAAGFLMTCLWLASACAAFPAPPAEGAARKGHLVIIGGGLNADHALVYRRILHLAGPGGAIGVIPTASGAPEESAATMLGDFARYGGPGRGRLIDITTKTPERAEDPAAAEAIRGCRGLYFTGGDQSRVTAIFRPGGRATLADQATREVLAAGGVIAGSSAGAALMSDPMLRWGSSGEALLIGASETEDKGVGVGPGMGYFPFGLTEQHFLTRGRLGRLIAALEASGVRAGFGVNDDRALHVDLASGRIETLGPRALLLVDMKEARREGLARSNIRLSLLGGGDLVDGETLRAFPATGKIPFAAHPEGDKELKPVEDVWGRNVIPAMIERLAAHPAAEITGADENFTLRLSEDEATRLWIAPEGDLSTLTAIGVRLDILPREGADERARAARLATPRPPQEPQ